MTVEQQWKTLNDVFVRGDTQIWYMRPEWFARGMTGECPHPNNLKRTHILLGSIELSYLDMVLSINELYRWLQGEFWSTNGEARTLICSKGLQHTSMSVGDCVRFANGKVLICKVSGWGLVTELSHDGK